VADDEDAERPIQGRPRLDGERMLTTAQVADRLQLSVALVRKAVRDGRLEASLSGGQQERVSHRAQRR
jgi:hypothetical protein